MRHAQIVTYRVEGKLLGRVRHWAQRERVGLRLTRHVNACLNVLGKQGASALLIFTGRDLEQELLLLERAFTLYPEVPSIVVGDSDHPALANLAWDLGATCVFMPLESFEHLEEALARCRKAELDETTG